MLRESSSLLCKRRLLALPLLALALAFVPPAPVGADDVNRRIPLAFVFVSPCTGEPIAFDGALHVEGHTSVSEGGQFTSQGHYTILGHGVSATGVRYVLIEENTAHSHYTVAGTGTVNYTAAQTFLVLRQGEDPSVSTDDYRVHYVLHLTITANGETTANFSNFRYECD